MDNVLRLPLAFWSFGSIQEVVPVHSLALKVCYQVAVNPVNEHLATLERYKLLSFVDINKRFRCLKSADVLTFLSEHISDFQFIVFHLNHKLLVKLLDKFYFCHLSLVGAVKHGFAVVYVHHCERQEVSNWRKHKKHNSATRTESQNYESLPVEIAAKAVNTYQTLNSQMCSCSNLKSSS